MQDKTIQLGWRVRDRISGFEGIVIDVADHISGCRRIGVRPAVDDSKILSSADSSTRGDEEFFYEDELLVVDEEGKFENYAKKAKVDTHISLGDEVVDDITDFSGTVTTISYNLFNTPQAAVSPDQIHSKEHGYDREWFDDVRLTVKEKSKFDLSEELEETPDQGTGAMSVEKNRPEDSP